MPAVQALEVTKQYGSGLRAVRALDHVSLEIDETEFVAIAGPSGAGKSTLLHLLGALDTPTSGTVRLAGVDLTSLDDEGRTALRRHEIGFVFQFFNLLPALRAWENVALPRLLDGVPLRRSRTRACELLDEVGLADRAEHKPGELSGGEMQRVAIARALIAEPQLILADEPTGNLDSVTGSQTLQYLRKCARRAGRALVLVTHDANVSGAADRVVTLNDGCLVSDVRDGDDSPRGPR